MSNNYPFDFHNREFKLVFRLRKTDGEIEKLTDYIKVHNQTMFYISSLAYFLNNFNEEAINGTHPTNIRTHLNNLGELIMAFSENCTIDESHFLEHFKLKEM